MDTLTGSTDASPETSSLRPRGAPITLTEIDERALAESARAGVVSPCQISPDFSAMNIEEIGMAMCVLEGRLALLEQRLHWVMMNPGAKWNGDL